ncbi:MAG: NAD(P)H-binding protein [Anaerolineae bacterium]|nr:NAD(P)H-binding protein [Anaerolineae bacterium]
MILVTGATGFVGRHLIDALAARGAPVRALIRPRRGRGPAAWGESVSQIAGTLENTEVLHQAMQGVHTIIHLASAPPWAGPNHLREVDMDGTRSLVTIARSVRIGRFITLSHIGADRASAYTLMRVKGETEEIVRRSGLAYTILRCGMVFGPDDRTINAIAMQLKANPFVLLMPAGGESLVHPLWIDDLVNALLNCLENPDTVDQTLEIGGPEYLTFNQMVRTIMRVTKTPRALVPIQPYWLRQAAWVFRQILPRPIFTSQWYDRIAESRTADLNSMSDRFGIHPQRFEDTILTYMPERRYGREMIRYIFGGEPF